MEQVLKEPTKSIQYRIFKSPVVKHSKDGLFKARIQTLILAQGMKELEFYKKCQLTKQLWYAISWGIWEPRDWLKIRIAKELGIDSRVIWP